MHAQRRLRHATYKICLNFLLVDTLPRLILCDLRQACFLKLAGPQLVQMFIGDGAKLVRDAFALAKEKSKPGMHSDRHILVQFCLFIQ